LLKVRILPLILVDSAAIIGINISLCFVQGMRMRLICLYVVIFNISETTIRRTLTFLC